MTTSYDDIIKLLQTRKYTYMKEYSSLSCGLCTALTVRDDEQVILSDFI